MLWTDNLTPWHVIQCYLNIFFCFPAPAHVCKFPSETWSANTIQDKVNRIANVCETGNTDIR